MAWQQSNFNPNQQQQNPNGEPAEKRNFPVGRVYGKDGLAPSPRTWRPDFPGAT